MKGYDNGSSSFLYGDSICMEKRGRRGGTGFFFFNRGSFIGGWRDGTYRVFGGLQQLGVLRLKMFNPASTHRSLGIHDDGQAIWSREATVIVHC